MAEVELFLWTGRIVWWIACATMVAVSVAAGIAAPLVAYNRVKNRMWRWKYAAIVGRYGLTQDDIDFVYRVPDMKPPAEIEDILEWVKHVKERTRVVDKMR